MQSKLRITPAPSNLTKYAQKTLCTKIPLRRGVTGKTFPDKEKNNKKTQEIKHRFRLGLPHWQPSKNDEINAHSYWVCHTGNPVTSTADSYDTEAQKFLQPGHYDSELRNCVLLALSNILQIPLVYFTSMENYPITQVIRRTRVLSEVPIYLADHHGDSGHYNVAVEVTRMQSNSATTEATGKEQDKHLQVEVDFSSQHEAGCSCGRGNGGKTEKSELCKYYRSRCPCFRNLRSCNDKCSCRSCANPFGSTQAAQARYTIYRFCMGKLTLCL